MPRFRCVTLPYLPPSPGKEPKAEDEKAPRLYSSVAEAERERGLVSEVCGTLEWADQFHFPRSTQPVVSGLLRHVPNAHDSAPRPGGVHAAAAAFFRGENRNQGDARRNENCLLTSPASTTRRP